MTTLTQREFDQNPEQARDAASDGPVFITEDGKPAQVLLSIEAYRQLEAPKRNLIEAVSMPGLSEIDLESMIQRPKTPPRIVEFD